MLKTVGSNDSVRGMVLERFILSYSTVIPKCVASKAYNLDVG